MEDEIDGAQSGIYLSRRHGGPLPFQPKKAIPELETALEALLEKGETASGLARKLGVSYRERYADGVLLGFSQDGQERRWRRAAQRH